MIKIKFEPIGRLEWNVHIFVCAQDWAQLVKGGLDVEQVKSDIKSMYNARFVEYEYSESCRVFKAYFVDIELEHIKLKTKKLIQRWRSDILLS